MAKVCKGFKRLLRFDIIRIIVSNAAIYILCCLEVYAQNTQITAVDDKQPRGFLWYNEIINIKDNKLKQKQSEAESKSSPVPIWDRNIEALKQKIETAKRKALDNPSFENVLEAQRYQKEASLKAQAFADMWKHVALVDSGIASNIKNSNAIHKRIDDKLEAEKVTRDLKYLSKKWALVLEIEESCPYCYAFAPIVKEFASSFGFQLLASSRNGKDFDGIQGAADVGQLAKYNPEKVTPVLYLINETGTEVYPVARGVTTEENIIEHIHTIDKLTRKLFK